MDAADAERLVRQMRTIFGEANDDAADAGDQPTVSAGATVVVTKEDEKNLEGTLQLAGHACGGVLETKVVSVADVVQFRNTGKHGIVVQGPHNGEFKVKWSTGDTSGWIDGQSLSAPTTEGIRIVSWLTWCKKDAFAKCEGKIGRVKGDPTGLSKSVRLEWADPEGGAFSSDPKKACKLEPCSKADFDELRSASWLTWCKKDGFAKCEGQIGRVMHVSIDEVELEWADPGRGPFRDSSGWKKAYQLEPCSKADFDRVVSLVKEYQDDIKAAGASTFKEYQDIKVAGASTLKEYQDIIKAVGASTLKEYQDIKAAGASTLKEYQDIKAAGASTLKEYQDIIKAVDASTFKEYQDIKAAGASTLKEYKDIKAAGASTLKEYQDIKAVGASTLKEYKDMKAAGASTLTEYKKRAGASALKVYKDIKHAGASTLKEYQDIKAAGASTLKEYQEIQGFERAFPTLSKFNFSQPFKEVGNTLSDLGVKVEGDLKYIEDSSLDHLVATQGLPVSEGMHAGREPLPPPPLSLGSRGNSDTITKEQHALQASLRDKEKQLKEAIKEKKAAEVEARKSDKRATDAECRDKAMSDLNKKNLKETEKAQAASAPSVSREAAEPLTREDKTKIRELRQRLLEEEDERIRRVEEERRRMEEEVRVTREEAELLDRKVQEASQMKAERDAARQKAAEERAAREREKEARDIKAAGASTLKEYQDIKATGASTLKEYQDIIKAVDASTFKEYQDIKAAGASTLKEYKDIKAAGASTLKEYQDIKAVGASTLKEYQDMKAAGASTFKEYQDIKAAGASTLTQYKKALGLRRGYEARAGASALKVYKDMEAAGASTLKEYQDMKAAGASTLKVYKDIKAAGASTFKEYKDIKAAGASTLKEYQDIKAVGASTLKEYQDMKAAGASTLKEYQKIQGFERAFPTLSKFNFSQPFKEVVHALSVLGVATEGDLKYIEDSSLDQLLTTLREPLSQGDKTKIRELRQRLVEEEEERPVRAQEERRRLEEEARMTMDEAKLLGRKAEEAAQKEAEGDAVRQKAAEERAARGQEELRARKEEDATLKQEEDELTKRAQTARKRLEEEKLERHSPILEADRIVQGATKQKSTAETQTKGRKQYKGCFGKCNHLDCRKLKQEHFEPDKYCNDPRVLAAALATSTEKLTQAKAAAAAARNDPSFLAAEAKAKLEEETLKADEIAFADKKAATRAASAATAKKEAEVMEKEAQKAAAAAKKEAAATTKANKDAAAAVKKHAEAKARAVAHAKAVEKHSSAEAQAREAFFKRVPFAVAKGKEAEEQAREALVLETRRQDEQSRAEEAERKRKQAEELRLEAAAATAKEEAEARVKEAQEAAAAAKKEAATKTKVDKDAAAAVKKHAEAKARADAHAKAADKDPIASAEAQARNAFFKRAAASGRVIGRVIYDSAVTERLIVGLMSRLEPDLSSSSFSFLSLNPEKTCHLPGFPKACFRATNLPSGLSLDAETGVIEGTPDCTASCQVTITAFNSEGEISATIPFKIGAERAPSSLDFDVKDTSKLIVGVETKLSPNPDFVAGVPAAKFEVSNAATLAARALEDTLRLATAGALKNAIQDVCTVHDEIKASVTALISHTERMRQLQGAMSQHPTQDVLIPGEVVEVFPALGSDLASQSLEELEEELSDLKAAERAAAEAGKYSEAQALQSKHDIKTQEVNDYRKFKIQCLDPLRSCCNEMGTEFGALVNRTKRAETLIATVLTHSKEFADTSGAVARELEKASVLTDRELVWLKTRELSGLQSAAVAGRDGILQTIADHQSLFESGIQQVNLLWKQATEGRQAALKQLTTMQGMLVNLAIKPLAMQQQVDTLKPQDLAHQLQRALDHVPQRQMTELRDKALASARSLAPLVNPSLEMLTRAPVMPQGVKLNEDTGEFTATLEFPVADCTITVRAFNDSGRCTADLKLSAEGQIAPAGLSYPLSAPSEFSDPPNSPGLLLLGDHVSMQATSVHAGLPNGRYSVRPALPAGVMLDAQTGEIHGTPSGAVKRKEYEVQLTNPSGTAVFSISLEVQKHDIPGPLEYEPAPSPGNALYKIFLVGVNVDILPVKVDANNHLHLDVSPPLPQGLTLDATTGAITGTPAIAIGKTTFTVTAHNMRDSTSTKIIFGIAADWKNTHPKTWTVEMCQTWLKQEVEWEEDDRVHLVNVDGARLITLQNKAEVASNFPSLPPVNQKLLAQMVNSLVSEWERKEAAAEDPALEALISNIRVAASELGLDVERSPDCHKDKFDAAKLVMGLPPDAGRGINPFLNYEGGEQALLAQAARGLDAIMEELDKHGTEEAKECAKYVREKKAGDSTERFQEGWKRDCDPVTGEVLESRMVADPSAPGGKRRMRFEDFCKHEIALFCRLTEAEVFALRFYTTAGFKVINWQLRDEGRRARQEPHKLAVLVFILAGAIKKLRAWAANSANSSIPLSLFRGMSVREIFDTFMEKGGTELAPMSTTAQLKIALFYSQGREGTISTLLWIRTENFMDRGVDLEWLSAFPHEKEYLYPPLSFLKPIQTEPTVLKIGSCLYQVVELKISMS